MWKTCQQKFYLTRMAGYPYVEWQQTKAAAIGTAFDIFIKDYIARKKDITEPHLNVARAFSKMTLADDVSMDEVQEIGRNAAKIYIDLGFAERFVKAEKVSLERELYENFQGVPILGKLDALVNGVPHDWKLKGFGSDNKTYHTKGHSGGKTSSGELIRSDTGQPSLELVNEAWAIQMLFYNWLTNHPGIFTIDEIICNGDEISIVTYNGDFSNNFDYRVRQELIDMWATIQGEGLFIEIQEPQPSPGICERYNTICEVADKCIAYGSTLGNRTLRETM